MNKIQYPVNLSEERYFGIRSNELIYIDSTDRKPKKSQPEYTRRYNGRNDWQIIYIHDGYGYFQYGNEIKKIGPYSLVVFKPNEPQLYMYLPEECPIADYIHFSGLTVEQLMKKFGLDDKPFYDIIPSNAHLLSEAFSTLQTQVKIFHNRQHFCWSYFLDILSKIAISISDKDNVENIQITRHHKGITAVLNDMHNDYLSKNTVEAYAAQMNLSPSRFAHIFKQITGYSPINYKNMLKLENAKQHLLNTNASIEEIAFQLEYSSVSQFSKAFKQQYGYTPSYYRRSHMKF